MNNTKLSEIMTTNIVTVGPNDSMELVENIFNNNKFHHLPVVDEDEKLLGILSKSDYLAVCDSMSYFNKEAGSIQNKRLFKSLLVKDMMHFAVAKLKPEHTVLAAAGYFKENLFHAIPIVNDQGYLEGIVTTFDLINFAFREAVV